MIDHFIHGRSKMDPAKSWFLMGIVLGIVLIWFGFLLAIVSLPLAKGEVRSRDYNYRPFRKIGQRLFGITADIEDKVNRKAAKWMIAYAVFMAFMGVCSIIFGVMSIGNPLIPYLLALIVVIILMIGAYAYALALARRERHNVH
jgi:uncharacterized membrane protein HdeD (DUF308 family)